MAWLLLLGGMGVWAAHFTGGYAIASLSAEITGDAGAPLARAAVIGWTVLCLLANAALFWLALRRTRRFPRGDVEHWVAQISLLLVSGSLIAVLWQGLVPVLGP